MPAEAQRQADRAMSDVDWASWLRVAQGWLSLLTKLPRIPQESFDQELADKDTGQDETKAAN